METKIKIGVEDRGIVKGNCAICKKNIRYKKQWMSDSGIFGKSEQLFCPTKGSVQRIGFGHSIAVCEKCFKKWRDRFSDEGTKLFYSLMCEVKHKEE